MTPPNNTVDEIFIPNDDCLKVPVEHCGSCIADYGYTSCSDMICCSHFRWRAKAKQALEQALLSKAEDLDHPTHVQDIDGSTKVRAVRVEAIKELFNEGEK